MRTKIYKIGFEIEGEFSPGLSRALSLIGRMKSDGSVYTCENVSRSRNYDSAYPLHDEFHRKYGNNLSTGEFNSVPYSKSKINDGLEIFDILSSEYSSGGFHWNQSAGFHIHLSFVPDTSPELRSMQFHYYFINSLKKEYPTEFKLREKNSYCKVSEKEEEIYAPRERYKAINFAALRQHGTLEFRIFPSHHPDKMKEYLIFTVKKVEEFLKNPPKLKFSTEIAGRLLAKSSYEELVDIKPMSREITEEAKMVMLDLDKNPYDRRLVGASAVRKKWERMLNEVIKIQRNNV